MLFILTGGVQIGKTRWLEQTIAKLAAAGVPSAGVIAPGIWREREGRVAEGGALRGLAGEGRFEKLGINNVLLPSRECVPFARRRDLAQAEGSFDPSSQSATAQLGWEISDEAIARVNAHFAELSHSNQQTNVSRETSPVALRTPSNKGATAGVPVSSAGSAPASTSASSTISANESVPANAPASASANAPANAPAHMLASSASLLVVDELGQLELLRGGGLTEAMALLEQGATLRFPHALIVVREWLLDKAIARFDAAWGGATVISPGDTALKKLFDAFDVASLNDKEYH